MLFHPLSQRLSCGLSGSPEAQLWPSSGNLNPYYLPHYSKLHNGDLFPGFDPPNHPSPDKTRMCRDIHIYSMYPTLSSVCLFVPDGSPFVFQSFGDRVSTGLCLLLCARAQRWIHIRQHSHYSSFPLHLSQLFHHFRFSLHYYFSFL